MNNRLLGLGEQNLDDDLPYTLMTYSNGPGFNNNFEVNTMGTNVTRMNLSSTNFINDREYRYSANGLRDSSTVHTLKPEVVITTPSFKFLRTS